MAWAFSTPGIVVANICQYLPPVPLELAGMLTTGATCSNAAFAVVSCSAATIKPRLGDCSIPTGGKTDCGAEGTTNQTCAAAGCCWLPVNPNPNNEPWCFKQSGPAPPPGPAPPAPPIVSLGAIPATGAVSTRATVNLLMSLNQEVCSKNDTAARLFPLPPFLNVRPLTAAAAAALLCPPSQVPFNDDDLATMNKYFMANVDIDGQGGVVASPDPNTPGGSCE